MSDLDPVFDALERLEWDDARRDTGDPRTRIAALTRRTALTGGAAGIAAAMLAACGGGGGGTSPTSAAPPTTSGGTDVFGSPKKMKFVFVNHVTTNPFFVPTRYGAEDA